MKNTTKIKVPKKLQERIEEIYPDSDNGYWCYANKGFYFADMDYGVHIVRENTQKELLEMARSLKPCECDDCMEKV